MKSPYYMLLHTKVDLILVYFHLNVETCYQLVVIYKLMYTLSYSLSQDIYRYAAHLDDF